MYFGGARPALQGRTQFAGVNAPSTSWFLAEGATGPFFETFVLLANPNASPVDADVDVPAEQPARRSRVRSPFRRNGRLTVNIEALKPAAPALANAAVATQVTSRCRSSWSARSTGPTRRRSGTKRTTAPASRRPRRVGGWRKAAWAIERPHSVAYQTFILLANPGATPPTSTCVPAQRTDRRW